MPKHVIRLVFLVAVFVGTAVAAKLYFTPESFYIFGHYRAESVREIAADTPQYRGSTYCQACHEERHTEWSATAHRAVKCEVCHGPARDHPANGKLPVPSDTVKLCTLCHETMLARPAAQPQIVVSDHAGTEKCVTCHNPHAPRIGGPDADQPGAASATAEVRLSQCVGCHGPDGLGVGDYPALAGKGVSYLVKQLQDYRSGARQHPLMNTIAKLLSDQDIADFAEHYASLKGRVGD